MFFRLSVTEQLRKQGVGGPRRSPAAAIMGADKDILNEAALASGVETLRSGLASFESSTRQMKSIFDDFEGRLGKLEGEMLPMKEISAKLTTSRRNIISAIGKVMLVVCRCRL